MSSVSGLSPEHRVRARDLTIEAAKLGLRRAASLHYTQGPRRWEGIDNNLKAWQGECPNWADCSAFSTWCLWNGLDHYGVRDVVNGYRWRAGYTGTQIDHGRRVMHRGNWRRADLVFYGDPKGGSGHVAIYVGGGKVISFGSERGPLLLPVEYRRITQVRRYI